MAKRTPAHPKDSFLKYLLYVTILLLGIVVGIAIRHFYDIPIIERINLIDMASLIVTIFLAIYIPGVFERRMEVRQDKKELLERRIGDLQDLYRNINMTVQQGEATEKERRILHNSLDVAANRFNTISTLLEYLDLDKTFPREISELRSLISSHAGLLNNARVENDLFPAEVQREEERLFNRIDKDASLLVFKISDI